MAITVTFVANPATKSEPPPEEPNSAPSTNESREAIPELDTIEKPAEPAEALIEPGLLPKIVPIPVRRPKPERRPVEKAAQDEPKVTSVLGFAKDSQPDSTTLSDPTLANETNATLAYAAARGMTRDAPSEQRWLGQLAAHLERRKRYPASAQARGQEGIVLVRFMVADDGTIVSSELVKSSGIAELDHEALDLLRRASPAPRPPPEVNTFITVPISFTIRR